jgi:hypothetical protein
MAVGLPLKTTYADGDVWSASDANDITGTINANATPYAAGKNKIINGAFNVWQRGTSFTTNGVYTADRWKMDWIGSTPTTWSVSQQTFTPGAAPVAGYEGQYYAQISVTTAGSTTAGYWYQRVEDVRTFAGQTITYSFWAKADSARTITIYPYQSFPATDWTGTGQNVTLTTSWARYSVTLAMPSVSGKTIGASSFMAALIYWPVASGASYQTWGHQMEAGSTATPFQTATGTIQGELAACQRYYQKSYSTETAPATNTTLPGIVFCASGNVVNNGGPGQVPFKVEMRVAPTVTIYSYTASTVARISDNSGADLGANSGVANYIGTRSFYCQNATGGTINAAFNGFIFHYVASAEL